MRLGAGDERGDLLLFDHLPVHELLDIGVIHVADHHLGRAARGAARLDGARRAVADLQKAHQTRGFAAARQFLALAAEGREVGAGARAVFEQPRLTDPQIHDPAFVHQIVADGLDEAGMGLRVFIGRVGLCQLARLEIDVEMPLRRAVDPIGPVQAGIEPLRAVRRGHLAREHVAHLVIIGAGVGFGGEIATLPAPIGPGACQTVKDLLGRGFAGEAFGLRKIGKGCLIGHGPPQEFRHALFLHALQARGHAGLAEILLRDDIRGDLAPAFGDFHRIVAEDDLAIGIADFRSRRRKGHGPIGAGRLSGKLALDLHRCPVSSYGRACAPSDVSTCRKTRLRHPLPRGQRIKAAPRPPFLPSSLLCLTVATISCGPSVGFVKLS